MKKKILITGGAGFIGSNLCEKLLQDENNTIICLDNFYTGKKTNIEKFFQKSNFEFIEYDIVNKIDLKVDEIYNLACPASPLHYQFDPIKTFKTSVLGVLNLIELAKNNNAKILQASTSEIYGNPLIHPQKETYFGNVNPIGIRSCYDEGKRAAETILSDYRRKENLKTKIVRIFNTFGKNMAIDDGRVVSNFIVQALKNEDITIYGDGSQTRSFCYVDDLVEGLIKMMNSDCCGPINLGNPDEYTVLQLADKIIKLTNSKSKLSFKNLPQDDPIKRKPDISLAKEKLNWKPEILLNDGLIKTIQYFKKIL